MKERLLRTKIDRYGLGSGTAIRNRDPEPPSQSRTYTDLENHLWRLACSTETTPLRM